MKKIIIISLLIFNICNLYGYNNESTDKDFIINDSSMKILTDAGVDITEEKKYTIKMITRKYLKEAKKILSEINEINIKLNKELKRENADFNSIKQLLSEKKEKEADFDYTVISCDLDILALFSDYEIKKIKYYIIFQK